MTRAGDLFQDQSEQSYEIIKPIAEGGMGYVLLSIRKSDSTLFAIKTLGSIFIEWDSVYRAIQNEWDLAEKIEHENVIKYTYFHNGEKYKELWPYIIMELANGWTLQSVLDSRIQSWIHFPLNELSSLFSQLINGMEAVNNVLVHRDIKPANILIADWVLKISDFGISKIAGDPTRSKSFKWSGTLKFLAPEVFSDSLNSILMDIYSMGVVFYMLATLKHPYELTKRLEDEAQWRMAHLTTIPELANKINSDISPQVSAIIKKMLEKNPTKRYQDWNAIRSDFNTISISSGTVHSWVIEKMMSKRLDEQVDAQKKVTERLKIVEIANQKKNLVKYQFENDILWPLMDFVNMHNTITSPSVDRIEIREYGYNSKLESKSGSFSIEFWVKAIDESDMSFVSERRNRYGSGGAARIEPVLRGKPVLAWWAVKDKTGKWMNLILCKSDTSQDYWDWFVLKNSHSPLVQRRDARPDPFPFEIGDEIREEIWLVWALHIYQTEVIPYSPEILVNFISDF